jgi:hypothetical protein
LNRLCAFYRVGSVSLANHEMQNQFAVPGHRQKRVLVAVLRIIRQRVRLEAIDESEQFVDLNLGDPQVFDSRFKELGAMLASRFEDVQDGALVEQGEPRYGANANALTKQMNNLGGLLDWNANAT